MLERWEHSSKVNNGEIYISYCRISATADTNDSFTYDLEREGFDKVEANSSAICFISEGAHDCKGTSGGISPNMIHIYY